MTVRDILSSAFSYLFEMEAEMNALCDKMADASPEDWQTTFTIEHLSSKSLVMASDDARISLKKY